MTHPFFDDLRNIENSTNGNYITPQIFDFSECTISLLFYFLAELSVYKKTDKKSLLKKIIPNWAESYKFI